MTTTTYGVSVIIFTIVVPSREAENPPSEETSLGEPQSDPSPGEPSGRPSPGEPPPPPQALSPPSPLPSNYCVAVFSVINELGSFQEALRAFDVSQRIYFL